MAATGKRSETGRNFRFILAALTCTTGMIAGAKINIDLPYVPVTLQTFFLCLSALFLAPSEVFTGQLLYLITGMFLPVFSGTEYGAVILISYSAGYLLAFSPAAMWLASKRTEGRSFLHLFMMVFLAHLAILLAGWLWLVLIKHVPVADSVYSGLITLLPGALIKSAAVTLLFRWLVRFQERKRTKVRLSE